MKIKNIFLLTSVILLAGCAKESEEPQQELSEHTTVARFDVGVEGFEGEDATRAETWEWKDKAVLYLTFKTSQGDVKGNAIYNASSDEWKVTYTGTIPESQLMDTEIVYLDNGDTEVKTSVSADTSTGIYACYDAKSVYQEGYGINIRGVIKPINSRVRFKGSSSIRIVGGLQYISSFNPTTNEFSYSEINKSFSVHSGYTDYIYYASQGKDVTLQVELDIDTKVYGYSRTISKMKGSGKSGWLDIPTKTSYTGWKQDYISYPKVNGHEAVDLGLSVKWATCNIGAKDDKPEKYGSYFAWGETSEKLSYDSSSSETCDKSDSWLTSNGYLDSKGNLTMEHDAARKNWGGTWRIPTKDEIVELINNTTTTWKTQNGVYGRLVTSKINGNSIFLPAAGYYVGSTLRYAGEGGDYWSSTPNESDTYYAHSLGFFSNGIAWRSKYSGRYFGQSVRAVSE